MAIKKIRVFLASSSELSNDRKEFEIFINRENKALLTKNIFLELVVWEDFIDAMSKTRLQDEYNKAILRSDIFVMLIHKKVGKYTIEEFETAFGQFNETGKPYIYTYFKDAPVSPSEINREDLNSLIDFRDKLKTLGHYWSNYENIDALKFHFSQQLSKLEIESEQTNLVNNEVKQKNKIFISYSHKDKIFLDRLFTHLRPLRSEGLIDLWVDTELNAGDKWKTKIEETLNSASVAILLISADFLASDFIVNNELPPLLTAADKHGTRIIPVIIKPCRFSRDKKLSVYQSINSPDKPLIGLSEYEQEMIYDKIVEWVEVYIDNH